MTHDDFKPVAIIKAYNDSNCTNETGAKMNVSLGEDVCFLGWTFSCTCEGNSKALIGKHYESLDCESGPSKKHIIPVGSCEDGNVTIESSGIFEIADDLGNCPCCGDSCTDPVKLQETTKESRPIIGDDFDISLEGPIVRELLYPGLGCHNDPFDTIFAPVNIHRDMDYDGGSSIDITPRRQPMIFLGFEFDCTCKRRKGLKGQFKGVDMFRFDYAFGRFIDEAEPMLTLDDGECHDFPFNGNPISIFLDASECPPCLPFKDKPGTCKVCGDPHVTVFDQAKVALLGTRIDMVRESSQRAEDVNDEFGWGDFWLVKSSQVSMQARYHKVYYPKASEPLNNTYLTAMAVGGPFMRGHRLIVEPRSGSVAWVHPDGSSMELFPSEETSGSDEDKEKFIFEQGDLIKAIYSKRTAIVADHGVVQGLDVELPSGVTLSIDRFGKHLDLSIEMPASAGGEGGLDGQCGNFNGDATDDTTELLNQRIGYQVPADELLFI